jgi:hypothetical protein
MDAYKTYQQLAKSAHEAHKRAVSLAAGDGTDDQIQAAFNESQKLWDEAEAQLTPKQKEHNKAYTAIASSGGNLSAQKVAHNTFVASFA